MCIDSAANNFVQSLSGADGYVTGEQADTQVRGARLEKQQEMKQNQQARALEKTLCLFRFGRVFLALTLTRPLGHSPQIQHKHPGLPEINVIYIVLYAC